MRYIFLSLVIFLAGCESKHTDCVKKEMLRQELDRLQHEHLEMIRKYLREENIGEKIKIGDTARYIYFQYDEVYFLLNGERKTAI